MTTAFLFPALSPSYRLAFLTSSSTSDCPTHRSPVVSSGSHPPPRLPPPLPERLLDDQGPIVCLGRPFTTDLTSPRLTPNSHVHKTRVNANIRGPVRRDLFSFRPVHCLGSGLVWRPCWHHCPTEVPPTPSVTRPLLTSLPVTKLRSVRWGP